MSDRPHIPVMMAEVLSALSPTDGETYVDGTFGAGGYTSHILDDADCNVIAIDRDPTAIDAGQALVEKYSPRLKLIQNTFGNAEDCIDDKIDGFVLDIGVSSMHKAIVAARNIEPITTTLQLAGIIETAIPRRRGDKIHPATRTFQALRIVINDELGELERALHASVNILKTGGRLVVVTFHSLEDRIVKNFLRDHTDKIESTNKYAKEDKQITKPFKLLSRKAILATKDEAKINPRARSAKLRSAIRTEVAV